MRNLGAMISMVAHVTKSKAHRVYETPIRWVCHSAASDSEQSPPIEAAIDAAAARPPVRARCTPVEKKGSMRLPSRSHDPIGILYS